MTDLKLEMNMASLLGIYVTNRRVPRPGEFANFCSLSSETTRERPARKKFSKNDHKIDWPEQSAEYRRLFGHRIQRNVSGAVPPNQPFEIG